MLHEEGLCPWKDSITAETREISRGTHKGRRCQGTPNSSVWSIHAEGYFPLQKICWNPSSMTVSSVLTKVSHPHISGILPQSHDFLRLYGGMGESAKTIIVVQIKDTAFCKGLCNQFLILKADLRQKRSPQVLYNIFLLVSAFKSLTEHEVLYLSDHWSSPASKDHGQSYHLLHFRIQSTWSAPNPHLLPSNTNRTDEQQWRWAVMQRHFPSKGVTFPKSMVEIIREKKKAKVLSQP